MTRATIPPADVVRILKQPGFLVREPSFWTLVGAEVVAGWIAVREHGSPMLLIQLFWGQTLILTVFSYFRIRYARVFTFGNYSCSSNGKLLPNTREGLSQHAQFAVSFSGLLLGIILIPVFFFTIHTRQNMLWLAGAVGLMLAHSLFEFIYDRVGKPSCEHIGNLSATPILRSLLLVFVAIPVGVIGQFVHAAGPLGDTIFLCILLVAKLVVDIVFYIMERFFAREVDQAVTSGHEDKAPATGKGNDGVAITDP